MARRNAPNRAVSGLLLGLTACLLAGCGQGENDPGPGGVTVGEARALDEAAQMLEERRLPPEDLRNPEGAATPSGTAQPAGSDTGAAQ